MRMSVCTLCRHVCLFVVCLPSSVWIYMSLSASVCLCVCLCVLLRVRWATVPAVCLKKTPKTLSESWCDPLRSLWSLSCHLYRAVIVGGSQPCVWPTATHKIQLSRVTSSKSLSCWSEAPLILGDSKGLSTCWNSHEVGDKLSCLILCYGPFKPLHKSLLWSLNVFLSQPNPGWSSGLFLLKGHWLVPGTLCVWPTTRWDVQEFRLEISPELKFQAFFYSELCQREALVTFSKPQNPIWSFGGKEFQQYNRKPRWPGTQMFKKKKWNVTRVHTAPSV